MVLPSSDSEIPTGQQKPSDSFGDFNNISFLVRQAIGKLQTATLVKVVACTNAGALSPVGFVDVVPMVSQLDGVGNPTEHTTIFNVPYFRLQGGANAIIMDPEVGDIGIACFASRDISKIKSTKAPGNPGSYRQFSFSDALYIGGMLNAVPTQYVQFSSEGIKILSPQLINLTAPNITMDATDITMNTTSMEITTTTLAIDAETITIDASASVTMTTPTFTLNGDMVVSGDIAVGGDVDADGDVTASGISLHNHKHGAVKSGPDVSGPPLP